MRIIICFGVTLAIHTFLGWEWTLLGGVLCGWMLPRSAWLKGMAVVGADWAAYAAYAWIVSPEPVENMLHTVGQIIGNLPAGLVVVLTIAIGCLLGCVGGLIGSQLAHLVRKPS